MGRPEVLPLSVPPDPMVALLLPLPPVLPLPVVPVEPIVEPDDAPEPMVPLLPVDPVVPVVPPAPAPVPVLPMGVFCELCWPAPVAALGLAVVGGVLCATAVPTTATVAKPASRVFSGFVAVISETP